MHWYPVGTKLLSVCNARSLTRDRPGFRQRIAAAEEQVSFATPGFSTAAPCIRYALIALRPLPGVADSWLIRRIGSIVLVVAVSCYGRPARGLETFRPRRVRMPPRRISRSPSKPSKQPLPSEREYRPVTTAIGTVVATRSISVRNELPGTVRRVALEPGSDRRARHSARRTGRRGRAGRAEGARSAGRARADAVCARHEAQRATRRLHRRSRQHARSARRRPRADRAHQGDDRSQDDPCAVPCARRHLRRASRAVPERRDVPDEPAGCR